jgi:bifunctional ADP-heptose synthase (sugar kinase/adenylyltransferase)
MNKFNEFMDKHYKKVFTFLLVLIFVNTCGNPTKTVNKRLDTLSSEVDSLRTEINKRPTAKDTRIIGLKESIYRLDSKNRTTEELTLSRQWHKELDSLEKTN